MNAEQFKGFTETFLDDCYNTLNAKADEYSSDSDRLHNFRQAANLQMITPPQALGGMMMKHIVSIYDMIKTGEAYSDDMWQEKIGDAVNYLVLLRALVAEDFTDDQFETAAHLYGDPVEEMVGVLPLAAQAKRGKFEIQKELSAEGYLESLYEAIGREMTPEELAMFQDTGLFLENVGTMADLYKPKHAKGENE